MCNIIHDFKAVEEVERALLDCMPSDKRTPFLQEIISPQRILHKHRVFMIFLLNLLGKTRYIYACITSLVSDIFKIQL